MTPAEIEAYNAGVLAALKIAKDTAEAIRATTRRPVHEGFAIAALAELVEAGKGLFLPSPPESPPANEPVPPSAPRPVLPAAMESIV